MYSIVIAMAMSGGAAEAPAFGKHGCCGGSYSGCCGGSCYGGGYGGCCGGWSTGCCGGSYSYGCCGGHGHKHGCCGGGFIFGHKHGCCGGYSSYSTGCCGGSYSGCCGGSYSGCCGGFGGMSYGCTGCTGVSYGCGGFGAAAGPITYGACYGAAPMMGSPVMGTPVITGTPVTPAPAPAPAEAPKKVGSVDAPATIVVSLPADAALTVDGVVTASTSSVRRFASPALKAGQVYSYTLKGEVVRDGKTVTSSKKVTVRAGEETAVNLEFANDSVAAR